MPETIADLLRFAETRLAAVDTPRLDAELLLADCLSVSPGHLRTWPERAVDANARARFLDRVARRAGGEPVAYLLGHWGFWSLELRVTPDVLVPRPETELLVELALAALPAEAPARVADLGTGSGAIALALARERPRWQMLATDRSSAALAVARDNAARLGITHCAFAEGDWCAALGAARFDLIVSNPPYIVAADPHLAALAHEPAAALASGDDGLDAIRAIAACTPAHLAPGGVLLLEHGYHQQDAVVALLREAGYRDVTGFRDLAGQPRAVRARIAIPGPDA